MANPALQPAQEDILTLPLDKVAPYAGHTIGLLTYTNDKGVVVSVEMVVPFDPNTGEILNPRANDILDVLKELLHEQRLQTKLLMEMLS
jgi:hypothetical protein